MGLFQKLLETYDACAGNPAYADPPPDEEGREAPMLCPVCCSSQKAHVRLLIDLDGKFLGASLFPKGASVVFPATDRSETRTSRSYPHALSDTLSHMPGAGNDAELCREYLDTLRDWAGSPDSHPAARAVLRYVLRGSILKDLSSAGIVLLGTGGAPLSREEAKKHPDWKNCVFSVINGNDPGKAFIAWEVEGLAEPRTWKDKTLFLDWQRYRGITEKSDTGFCMLTGKMLPLARKHPKNLLPGKAFNAKLISGNDMSDFTFRGKFISPDEACSIGFEPSQKAHAALRWLMARQGWMHPGDGSQAVLAWAVDGTPVPGPCRFPEKGDLPQVREDAGRDFARETARALAGRRADLSNADGIMVLACSAATSGRLSVTFYREMFPEAYFDALSAWASDFCWVERDWENGGFRPFVPSIIMAARAACGITFRNELVRTWVDRLLPCVTDMANVPLSLVLSCMREACRPMLYAKEERWKYERVLQTACALFKGYDIRAGKKEYAMSLEENCRSRDYLFGRLLAVGEYVERTALNKILHDARPTNAERLMAYFADHPTQAWRQIETRIMPYRERLRGRKDVIGFLFKADKALDEIMSLFEKDDFLSRQKLGPEFLLGYHCQRRAMYEPARKAEENAA